MKKIIITLVCLAFGAVAFAQEQIVVDGNAVLRKVNPDFKRIKVSGAIRLILSQASEMSLAVSAENEKAIEGIKTEVANNTLNIYWDGEFWSKRNNKLTVYLSFKDLEFVEGSGAANILFSGQTNLHSLQVHLSGASRMRANVNTQTLNLKLSGASEAKMQGVASRFDVECDGASDVKCYDLVTQQCNANASGASDMELNVQQEFNAVASGASHIYYKGNASSPSLKSSGVSKIEKRF